MRMAELEQQLINKKKTVAELVNIIGLRTDRNPNFSVLLGAGCSISSGIKSASTLIQEWRSELCPGVSDVEEQKNSYVPIILIGTILTKNTLHYLRENSIYSVTEGCLWKERSLEKLHPLVMLI